jgi:hypothetical protein
LTLQKKCGIIEILKLKKELIIMSSKSEQMQSEQTQNTHPDVKRTPTPDNSKVDRLRIAVNVIRANQYENTSNESSDVLEEAINPGMETGTLVLLTPESSDVEKSNIVPISANRELPVQFTPKLSIVKNDNPPSKLKSVLFELGIVSGIAGVALGIGTGNLKIVEKPITAEEQIIKTGGDAQEVFNAPTFKPSK